MIVNGIRFYWSYGEGGEIKKKINGKRVKRKAILCTAKSLDDQVMFIGMMECSVKDVYNKETGRRKSLADLLLNCPLPLQEIFNKDFRSKVWETYRTLTKEPRWNAKQKVNRGALIHEK